MYVGMGKLMHTDYVGMCVDTGKLMHTDYVDMCVDIGKLMQTDYVGMCVDIGKLRFMHAHTYQWCFVSSFDNDTCVVSLVAGLINLRIFQVT